MTVTAHNQHPHITNGDDARVRVRGPEDRRGVPIRPDATSGSAHARAIPDKTAKVKTKRPSKVRDFLSTHLSEARAATEDSWLAEHQPRPLRDVAHAVTHPATIGGAVAGPFRLAVYTIAYLMCATVDTNRRTAITFALLVFSTTAAWAISAYAGT